MSEVMLSEEVTTQLQQMAAQTGETPKALAERAIREFLRAAAREAMRQEVQAFRAQHTELLKRYAGRYIAMYKGQVVDEDADQLALLARVEERYPHTTVLITQVLPDPEETYTVRSPRWEHGL